MGIQRVSTSVMKLMKAQTRSTSILCHIFQRSLPQRLQILHQSDSKHRLLFNHQPSLLLSLNSKMPEMSGTNSLHLNSTKDQLLPGLGLQDRQDQVDHLQTFSATLGFPSSEPLMPL